MRGNITRRGKSSWRLKFESSERDPLTGKRQTKFITVRGTKREAEHALTKIMADLGTGSYVEPSKLKVAEYLDRWLDHVRHRVGAKTFQRYEEIAGKHLTPALGSCRLGRLTPLQIQEYYGQALATGRRNGNGGLSARTVAHHHRVLSRALHQAVRWRLLALTPVSWSTLRALPSAK